MSYVVVVHHKGAPGVSSVHGSWNKQSRAEATADSWNRTFAAKGWPLFAQAVGVLSPSAASRDNMGEFMVKLVNPQCE